MNDDFDYKPEESSEPEAPEAQENGAAQAPYTDVFSGENTETVDFEAEAAAAAADAANSAANSAAAETEAKAYEAADNMGYVPPAAPAAAEEPAVEPAPAYTQPEPEIPVVEAERTGPSAPYNANPYSYGQPGAQNQSYQSYRERYHIVLKSVFLPTIHKNTKKLSPLSFVMIEEDNCFKEKGNYGLPSVTIIVFPFLMNIPLPCGRLSRRRPCIS